MISEDTIKFGDQSVLNQYAVRVEEGESEAKSSMPVLDG